MAYTISDTVFDEALDYIKQNATKMVLLDADPAGSYSDANTNNGTGSGMKIAEVTMAATDFTLANGATDGRKVTSAAKTSVAVVANGDATHVAWLDVTGTEVLFVTQLTTTRSGLTTSDTVDFPTIFAAIRDAVVAS